MNIVKGSLYALIAFFCMAVFGILTKIALQNTSVIWVSFLAYLIGSSILALIIFPKGTSYLKSNHYSFLVGRALFGCAASFLYSISINYISIVNSTLLFNTAPIFIPILATFWLKHRIKTSIWLAVLLGFIGVAIIIKPTEAIFTQTGNLIGIFSGISLAIAYLLMKELTNTDPGIRIIFYYLGIGTLVQMPLLFFAGPFPALETAMYALTSGVVLLLAQLALVKAYTYAQASQIGIYQYTTVVFVGALNWLLWNSLPEPREYLGILLVIIAGIMIIRKGNAS